MEVTFRWSNGWALPFWVLMIMFPRWRWTERIMRSPLVIAPLAATYAGLVAPRATEIMPVVTNPSLPNVTKLLGRPDGATIGWIHFLAFDLFVGRWAYLDSRARGISAWLMAPVLFLILMLGPAGWLLYVIVRLFARPAAPLTTPGDLV